MNGFFRMLHFAIDIGITHQSTYKMFPKTSGPSPFESFILFFQPDKEKQTIFRKFTDVIFHLVFLSLLSILLSFFYFTFLFFLAQNTNDVGRSFVRQKKLSTEHKKSFLSISTFLLLGWSYEGVDLCLASHSSASFSVSIFCPLNCRVYTWLYLSVCFPSCQANIIM